MSEVTFDVTESVEGGYEARALGFSIFTQGETLEELREMARDAVVATSMMRRGHRQYACI